MKKLSSEQLENISGDGFISGFCGGWGLVTAVAGMGSALGWIVIASTGPAAVGAAVITVGCGIYGAATL
jgi:hypothetical protein